MTHTATKHRPRPLIPAALLLTPLICMLAGRLDGLKAAGLTGTPPDHAQLITTLVATMTSNWLWLVGTGIGLVLTLLAGMMTFGSRQAPDALFRVIAGIGLILVVIPAALA